MVLHGEAYAEEDAEDVVELAAEEDEDEHVEQLIERGGGEFGFEDVGIIAGAGEEFDVDQEDEEDGHAAHDVEVGDSVGIFGIKLVDYRYR